MGSNIFDCKTQVRIAYKNAYVIYTFVGPIALPVEYLGC